MLRLLKMLDRKGWTLSEYRALPQDEQEMWLAYEMHREHALNEISGMMQKTRKTENGREFSNWTAEVATLVLLEMQR